VTQKPALPLILLLFAAPPVGSVAAASPPAPMRPIHPRPPKEITFLRGQVLKLGTIASLPVAYAKVNLLRAGKLVDTTATDRRGHFVFTRDLPTGTYELVLASDDFQGRLKVVVDSRTPEVVLIARDAP
jgi:hypothetical protein